MFVGTDPRVPGYHARMGIVVGSNASRRLPWYAKVDQQHDPHGRPPPRRLRRLAPDELEVRRRPALEAADRRQQRDRAAGDAGTRLPRLAAVHLQNVVIQGKGCSEFDLVGPADLDGSGRPRADSSVIDGANRHYAPATDAPDGRGARARHRRARVPPRAELLSAISPGQVRAFRLARQHLTDPLPAERLVEAVSAVNGVQAQVMSAAELAIWARCEGLSPGQVQDSLWERRELVKTWCMRGTLHLLPAGEWPLWAAALAQRAQWRRPAWLRWFGLTLEEMEELIATIGAHLDAEGKTREELAAIAPEHLREEFLRGWGSHLKPAASAGLLVFGPNRGRNVTFVHPEAWLGTTGAAGESEDASARAPPALPPRLRAGDAPGLRAVVGRRVGGSPAGYCAQLEGELEEVEAEGRTAWVLAEDAELLRSLDRPRSIHLLPVFDVYTLHYRPREAFLPPDVYDRIYRTAGWISSVVLVDGAVAGVWEQKKRARQLEVRVELFVRETKRLRTGIARETKRLGEFLELPVELQL